MREDSARAAVAAVIDDAPGLTSGELRAQLNKATLRQDPEAAKKRYEEGIAGRRMIAEPNMDGTACLVGEQLAPDDVNTIRKRIERIARGLKTRDEERTLDQLRADVFVDLLMGGTRTTAAKVELRIDLKTLAALNDNPGEIPGWGPVLADIARQMAEASAQWSPAVTDPKTGRVLWTGTTRRRPDAALRRKVETKSPTCVFPGCRIPASGCDIDHRRPWAGGGKTLEWNLAPLCRHDHSNKHRLWRLNRQSNGDFEWRSPLGHSYVTQGHPP